MPPLRTRPEPRGPGRPPQVSLEEILDVAEQVGLDRLTRAAVADRLGVSAGTIRHHVDSADRLYSRACARVFARMDVSAGDLGWQDYLRALSVRFAQLITDHPGVEDYVLRGPYEDGTIAQFQHIIDELIGCEPKLTPVTAHLLGSRVLTLSAAVAHRAPSRYPAGAEPPADLGPQLFAWTLDAFIAGAAALIDDGRVPDVTPTPQATWARIDG